MKASFWKVPAALALAFAFTPSADAQATRTWVSGVGDDANPCSRTAPCKTFAGAISRTAAAGEINCLDPGGFGTVTITKSMTILCDATLAGIAASGTNGIVVNAGTTDTVFLSGLDIQGFGTGLDGIKVRQAGRVHIKNTIVRGFTVNGVAFVSASNAKLVIQDSVISENPAFAGTGGGVLIKPGAGVGAQAALTNVQMNRNKFGIRTESRSHVTLANCTASGNSVNGVLAVSTAEPAVLSVLNSTISDNTTNGAVTSGAAASILLQGSTIFGNGTGINTAPGGTISGTSPSTNTIAGNTTDGTTNATVTLT